MKEMWKTWGCHQIKKWIIVVLVELIRSQIARLTRTHGILDDGAVNALVERAARVFWLGKPRAPKVTHFKCQHFNLDVRTPLLLFCITPTANCPQQRRIGALASAESKRARRSHVQQATKKRKAEEHARNRASVDSTGKSAPTARPFEREGYVELPCPRNIKESVVKDTKCAKLFDDDGDMSSVWILGNIKSVAKVRVALCSLLSNKPGLCF